MLSFYIDWLDIYNNEHYQLVEADGLSAPEYRLSTYENPGRDGSTVSSGLYGARTVTLTGNVKAPNAELYKYKRRDLATVCRIRRDENNLAIPTTFTFTTDDGEEFLFYGFPKALKMGLEQPTWGDFYLSVLVPDPMLYAAVQQTTGEKSRPAGGGTTWPITWPAIWSPSTGGSAVIYNYGNADSWPLIIFRGDINNPSVYSTERGKYFKLNYVLSGDDEVAIDMRARTVMLNGTTSLLSYKSDDSDWFSLAPEANNTLTFTSASTADTGTMEVTWYASYLGL